MKRVLMILTALALFLSGCAASGQMFKEPVTFYYVLEEYEYGGSSSIIASEEREAAGHRDDLSYLMALYLVGPTVEGLRSPIPRGTRIFTTEETEDSITLKLSNTSSTMSDAEFTQACACLSLTCLGLTEADSVTILSGTRSVTMTRDNLILFDGVPITKMEESK